MTIAKQIRDLALAPKGAVMLAGLALALIGAVAWMRGPELTTQGVHDTVVVTLQDGRALNVQRREVTVAEWQTCHHSGGCTLDLATSEKPLDFPATGISYPDAMEYVHWINAHSDTQWRLPSAVEWHEFAAEVMPETPDPIFTDPSLTWASAYLTKANQTSRALRPSGSFNVTSAGIQDLDGNVWEWTQDCYAGASGQGAQLSPDRCPAFIMGGEHEAVMSYLVRDPALGGCAVGSPPAHLGMRLVSDRHS